MKPHILYEDNHLLSVDKPHGWLTQPSGTEQQSLEACCKEFLKERDGKQGGVFLHALHRLDKPVGGVVLFAKSSKALARLNASMRDRSVKKEYEAIIAGRLPNARGKLQHFLVHSSCRGEIVSEETEGAKLAKLSYEVIEEREGVSKVAILLETGRYHQIRAQFAAVGCPILGDWKYGSTRAFRGEGIALIHKKLTISHPTSKELIQFETQMSLVLKDKGP